MSIFNDTRVESSVFLLTGIPGQEAAHIWISIPSCSIYVVSMVGNTVILFIAKTDPSLHEPMYIFLSMLALTDLGLSISTVPTVMGIFWFNAQEISFTACFAQLFFIHALSFIESSVLLSTAFDRYVAICNPLRYASILTIPRIAKIGLAFMLKGVLLIFPLLFLLKRFQYCKANVLSHSYCSYQEVMKMACSDMRVNSIYGLFVIISTVRLDSLLILLSYVMILRAVLSIASQEEHLKALNTCVSHICAVLLFCTLMIVLSIIHQFGRDLSPLVQILMGCVYLLVLPLMNPIVYSMKTKWIHAQMVRTFFK